MLAHASISVPSTVKCSSDVAPEQPVAVLGEHGHVPDRIVDPEPGEPAEQQVVVELLHQLALGADRIERLEQECPEQLLGRARRPADRRLQPGELRREIGERGIDQGQDAPARMISRDPGLAAHIREQAVRPEITTTHRPPHIQWSIPLNLPDAPPMATFSAPC
jgi:hypothetical protein